MEWLAPLGILGALAVTVISLYNRLVALRQNRNNAYADIDVQLKQRFDLIPNLVETVKGYAGHEKDVFEKVTKMRAKVSDANNPEERLSAEQALGKAMINVMAVAENYPELKADQNFQQLMAELSDIENKIAAARRFFNNATSEYNTAIQQFPANLIAGPFGFKTETFYEVEDAEREALQKAPDIKFGT
ncbi:MAG: LemA family protein [Alphaproteobacteria bacterium]|nr:LemA family protein [Alphaproteobacteria bacterium]